MKKIILIAVLLAVLPAVSFAFTVTAPEETIKLKAIAETPIQIKAASLTTDAITATIQEPKPWISLNETQFTVQGGTTKSITLFVTPFADVILGTYGIQILFKSLVTGEEKKATIFINVLRGDVLNIERISVTGSLEPLGSVRVQVFIKNYKPVSADGAGVFVRVSGPGRVLNEFSRVLPRLDPDQTQTAEFNIFFDKGEPAGSYEAYARVTYINETAEYRQTFDVKQKALIQKETTRQPTVFGFEKRIILTNNGNTAGEEAVTEYLSPLESAFFTGDAPTLRSSGVYTWVVRSIQPGEMRYIIYRIDYTPLFLFVVAVLILAWVVFFKLKTVRIKKYIVQKKHLEAGEEFTVAIEVTNKLGGVMDIGVHDFVPAVFGIKDAEGPKPAKKKAAGGAELAWHVHSLHHNEARILTYKIVPIFGVHGVLRLPKASVSFKWRNKILTNSSGSPHVGLSAEAAESLLRMRRKK